MKQWISLKYALISNILEWYDFVIILQFLPHISELFFPEQNQKKWILALLISGHAARFIGGFLFGFIGDIFGRKYILLYTAITMGLCCLLTSVLIQSIPKTNTVPLILLGIRIIQGMTIGCGYSGTLVYATEQCKDYAILASGLIISSSAVGILLANIISEAIFLLLTESQIKAFGWRIAIATGAIIPIYIIANKKQISETSSFEKKTNKVSYLKMIGNGFCNIIVASSVGLSVGILYTIFNSLIIIYGYQILKQSSIIEINLLSTVFVLTALISSVLMSFFAQNYIKPNQVVKINLFIVILCSLPLIKILIKKNFAYKVMAQILFGILLGSYKSILGYLLVISFPVHVRVMFISLSNNICAFFSHCLPILIFSNAIECNFHSIEYILYAMLVFAAISTYISTKFIVKNNYKI